MIGTKHKFRHYRMVEGRRCLIWASDGLGRSEEIVEGEVVAGSPADLEVRRSQLWTPNALGDEGEKDILDVYFDDVAVRGSLYGRLFNDTPTETDGLADLVSEVSGTGYSAVTWTRGTDWTDPALDTGDMQTQGSTKTFSASGTWSSATYLVMATVASGTAGLLILYVALSATRTLSSGDTLDVDVAVKLS